MKHSDSTEMDRLLRRHARRNGETMRAFGDSQVDSSVAAGAHMDADEISAYAEGALPEAARSRYIAHLADCGDCRKIVTTLTLATGTASEERARVTAAADTSTSKSWREWLAALISPPVLRYGVPALVLLAVIVVAFVATRTQRDEQFTARNETGANQARSSAAPANANMPAFTDDATAESHSNSNSIILDGKQQPSPSSATTTAAPVTVVPGDQDAPSASAAGTIQTTDQTPGADTRAQGEIPARKDDVASGPASPPPPPAEATPAPKADEGKGKQQAQKKAGAERDEERIANQPSPSTAGTRPAQNEIAEDRNTAAKSEGTNDKGNRARRPVYGMGKTTSTPSTGTSNERAAETQQVAGRQFRRQGNAWVDTAYKSSRSLTNVARGSEQYRALLADEPGLRTVAEQLRGEVIVVWKSRAYRFH